MVEYLEKGQPGLAHLDHAAHASLNQPSQPKSSLART
jgi:hypothetical protein